MILPLWMDHWSLNRHLNRAHFTTADLEGDDWQGFITGRSNLDLRLFHMELHIADEPGSDTHWHKSFGLPRRQPGDSVLSVSPSEHSLPVSEPPTESPLRQGGLLLVPRRSRLLR